MGERRERRARAASFGRGSKDPPLMFKLSSAASLDDDSAAKKDAHCPLLLPCTLSSVHPREDEGLEGEARRAWWATQRVAPYNLAQRHAPPTHCRRTSPPQKPPPLYSRGP